MDGLKMEEFKRVLGVDILPASSPSSKTPPKYAAFLLENGEGRLYDRLSKRELIALINSVKPDIVAMDNVFELASNQKGIISFMASCPPFTRLVQVTGSPVSGALPLSVVASQNGFQVGELSPAKAAEVCARLAANGVGYVVRVFENETRIVVARGRCPGHGGWSSERFKRRMYNLILQTTKEIQRRLDEAGIEYDLHVEEVEGGAKRSKFTVYAERSVVNRIVKPYRGDIIVAIQPILLERLEWIPLAQGPTMLAPKKWLIIGIDPGVTCGVAVLDLNGNLLLLESEKDLSRMTLVRKITSLGIPVLLASDVNPPPSLLEKLAGMLNSRVFCPPRSLTVSEKRELVQKFVEEKHVKVLDSHQRDALASALKAFHTFKNKFERAEAKARSLGHRLPSDQLKVMVLRGLSVSEAISILSPSRVEKVKEEQTPQQPDLEVLLNKLESYRAKIKRLRRGLIRVREQNVALAAEKSQLEEELQRLRETLETINIGAKSEDVERLVERYKDEIKALKYEIFKLKEELSNARHEIASMKRMRAMEIRGVVYPLKVVKRFTQNEIRKTDEAVGINKGDIVLLLDGSGGGRVTASVLIEKGVKAVISKTAMSHLALEAFLEANIPVFFSDEVPIKQVDEFAIVDKNEFDALLSRYFEEKEKAEREEQKRRLEKLLETYRMERELA
ncbi:MAG: DUF460 domain-containing protein [Candidatus Freyarchaeota archaeon]|nr:DUF460 domain-containing protein [Candidatus Jordarchaeia archaeon]